MSKDHINAMIKLNDVAKLFIANHGHRIMFHSNVYTEWVQGTCSHCFTQITICYYIAKKNFLIVADLPSRPGRVDDPKICNYFPMAGRFHYTDDKSLFVPKLRQ